MASSNLAVVTSPEPPERPTMTHPLLPGRALIGWMQPESAHAMLQFGGGQSDAAAIAAVERARRSVAIRPSGVNQKGLVAPAPSELTEHEQALRENPASQMYYAEGWQVALVDLSRVCACQPVVVSSQAAERVAGTDSGDLVSIAAVTLPLTQGDPVPARYDPAQK